MTIVLDQLKQIVEQNKKSIQIAQNIERVQDQDTERDNQLIDRVAHLEVEFKRLGETVRKIPKQTQDQVAEATEPFMEEAQNLKDVIAEKKIIAIDIKKEEEQKKHKSWFRRLFRR